MLDRPGQFDKTNDASQLSELFSRLLNLSQRNPSSSLADILTSLIKVNFESLEWHHAIYIFKNRIAKLTGDVESLTDSHLTDKVKAKAISALDDFYTLTDARQLSMTVSASNILSDDNLTALEALIPHMEKHKPLRKFSDEELQTILEKIDDVLFETGPMDVNLPDWAFEPIRSGLKTLQASIQNFSFYGYQASIAAIFDLHAKVKVIYQSVDSIHDEGLKKKLLKYLSVATTVLITTTAVMAAPVNGKIGYDFVKEIYLEFVANDIKETKKLIDCHEVKGFLPSPKALEEDDNIEEEGDNEDKDIDDNE